MSSEEQLDELEALRSIYDNDMTELTTDPPCFMIKLNNLQPYIKGTVSLRFMMPLAYPSVIPSIELPMRTETIPKRDQQQLVQYLIQLAEENVGMAMVFTLVDEAVNWINENVAEIEAPVDIQENSQIQEDAIPVKLEEPKVSGGRWDYIIGLVGKPSAGKSTFFNAATTLDLARTGAHPFTTIEPNIGKAFYTAPCPCHRLTEKCNAAHGHNYAGERNIPILLKDVAGLVPGAWEGKGKGNRFLNDLLDADVLIHIVDASGQTNEKGEITTDYDPASDIQWLQEELHQWIYQNVFSKWDNIIKRPQRLVDMFTGYHANKATILTAFHNAGINDRELSTISTWNESVLHRIVDHFLQVRFPIMLVLNKADTETSIPIIERLSNAHNNVIPVSAQSECYLQKLTKDGIIMYTSGQSNLHIVKDLKSDDPVRKKVFHIEKLVLKRYGSCNVHEALCQAVKLRPPVYAFPVHCVNTLQSIGKPQSAGRDILRDCISVKPGTNVEELYKIMCHYPINLISGDFVRAETVLEDGKTRPVKKDEVISEQNCIVKIMTTKRTS